ncbi:carbohydrate ABC transporter permease, partial [Streptomyces sp. SID7499]|nr:carbohydrate ABC transporter permease [Streptomyces sp. SID7499]
MSTQTATPDAPPAPTQPRRAGRRSAPPPDRRGRGITSRVVVNGILAVVAVYTLMPLTWLLIASTKS